MKKKCKKTTIIVWKFVDLAKKRHLYWLQSILCSENHPSSIDKIKIWLEYEVTGSAQDNPSRSVNIFNTKKTPVRSVSTYYITTSPRFKCVIQKWSTPLDILAYGLGFIPLGIHFSGHGKLADKFGYVHLGQSEIFW